MESLHRAFQGQARITTIASLGFQTFESPLHRNLRTYSLKEQCAHKAAYLRQHILPAHRLPVVLLGHSIGLYMVMRAIRMLESLGDSASEIREVKTRRDHKINDASSCAPNGLMGTHDEMHAGGMRTGTRAAHVDDDVASRFALQRFA
jgi:hypothetical protein